MGGVEKYFGAFISLAAYIQGPIIGMILVDYFIIRKRKLSLKSAYNIKGHDAYRYTSGYNVIGLLCIIIACVVTMMFVYNPYSGTMKSNIFLFTTGSGFTAILGGLLYYIASVSLFKKYMIRDREDIDIV